jgi:hypothetical protein
MVKIGCTTIQISEVDQMTIKRLQETYQFKSIEQTISVMIDFIQSPLDCTSFDRYVRRAFPSKFI